MNAFVKVTGAWLLAEREQFVGWVDERALA
jgi:hypothetical protein